MEITINNEQYKYYLVGDSFCRPSMSSFGITEEDIVSYNKYMEDYKKLESKRENVALYLMLLFSLIVYIIELLCIFNHTIKNPTDILNKYDWDGCLLIGFSALCVSSLVVFFQAAFLSLFIHETFWKKLALRIINKEPAKPSRYDAVKNYLDKSKEFSDKESDFRLAYPGIYETDYDLQKFGEKCIHSLVEELISFTDFQNGIIYKDNIRQEQKYWFDLDPFEFEKEVAYWYEQQGYKTQVTQKSGDNGVDIIISKDNYTAYVQCKRYRTAKVDRPTLNALYGVVCANNVNQGIVVCLLGITDAAKEFANNVGIKVVTVDDLAPKDDLFHHKIIKKSLNACPVKANSCWVYIGNFALNTYIYKTNVELSNQMARWDKSDLYHPFPYKGLIACIHCSQEDFSAFTHWEKTKYSIYTYTKPYKRKYYNRRRY